MVAFSGSPDNKRLEFGTPDATPRGSRPRIPSVDQSHPSPEEMR